MKQVSEFRVHKGWQVLASDMGVRISDILEIADLPADLFNREGVTLSVSQYFKMLEALEQVAGAQNIGILMGEAMTLEAFDPSKFACLCSPNMAVAFQRLSKYKRLIGPMIFHLQETEKRLSIEIECYGYDSKIPRSLGLIETVILTRLARLGTRKPIAPTEVVLTDLPDDPLPYETFFGASIRKGSSISISFSAVDAKRPFLTDNPQMWEFFDKELSQRLADLDAKSTFSQRVRSTLFELLPAGKTGIEDVAHKLAISKRTLQRYLKSEDSNYLQILNSTRERLAEHYLEHSLISTGEISFLLGFQDHNSFQRAFKSWKGVSPNRFRIELSQR